MSDRELDCLLLRAEGLEYEEIAETMGVRSGTVGALLSRAQHKLRPSGESVSRGLGTLEAIRFLFREARTYSAG